MKSIMGSHLTNAAKLSNDWGPPLPLGPRFDAQGLVVDRGTKESTRFTRGTLRRLFKGSF